MVNGEPVLFTVRARWRQYGFLRIAGFVGLVVSGMMMVGGLPSDLVGMSATGGQQDTNPGLGWAGLVFFVVCFCLIWLSRKVKTMRLRVTERTIWCTRWSPRARPINPLDIRYLSDNPVVHQGGLIARDQRRKKLFDASAANAGFDDLVDYIKRKVPDVEVE